jgi:hypothetical protein
MSNTLYDLDFVAWAHEQAALLRSGHLSEAYIDRIAEEIESLARTEKRELVSRPGGFAAALAQMALSTGSARRIVAIDHSGAAPRFGASSARQPEP